MVPHAELSTGNSGSTGGRSLQNLVGAVLLLLPLSQQRHVMDGRYHDYLQPHHEHLLLFCVLYLQQSCLTCLTKGEKGHVLAPSHAS